MSLMRFGPVCEASEEAYFGAPGEGAEVRPTDPEEIFPHIRLAIEILNPGNPGHRFNDKMGKVRPRDVQERRPG